MGTVRLALHRNGTASCWSCKRLLGDFTHGRTGTYLDFPQSYFVKRTDHDGEYWEEPPGRRHRRVQVEEEADRQRNHPTVEFTDESGARSGVTARIKFGIVARLPTRVRCPDCGWLNGVVA